MSEQPDMTSAGNGVPQGDARQGAAPRAAGPIEAVAPEVLATPAEVAAPPGEDVTWWKPTWRDYARHVGWRWIFVLPAVLVIAGFLLGVVFMPYFRTHVLRIGFKPIVIAFGVFVSLAGYGIRQSVRTRREPFCIHCGYNLTGLPDNYRCPECGRNYNWRLIEEYRRDPQGFIERWKAARRLPPAETPFAAGTVKRRRRAKDGTE